MKIKKLDRKKEPDPPETSWQIAVLKVWKPASNNQEILH